jgi:CRISPR-associated protein Cmr1
MAGEQQLRYRSWGYRHNAGEPHKVGRDKAEQNFKQSHDLMQDVSKRIQPDTLPDKVVFGLPQNYQFRRTNEVDLTLGEPNRSRRASPLWVHLHKFPQQENYLLLHTLLPAVFLEENAQLSFDTFKREDGKRNPQASFTLNYRASMIDWSVIGDYLNRKAFLGETV